MFAISLFASERKRVEKYLDFFGESLKSHYRDEKERHHCTDVVCQDMENLIDMMINEINIHLERLDEYIDKQHDDSIKMRNKIYDYQEKEEGRLNNDRIH